MRRSDYNRPIEACMLGTLGYAEALDLQQRLHAEVCDGRRSGLIVCLDHRPVLTLGKNADSGLILLGQESLLEAGIEVVRTDRGGEVTAHEPGQLVIYPILPLRELRLTPKVYVDHLLQAVILTLAEYGVVGTTDARYPGVWVGSEKICAVGVRIKDRVSLHGIALNVSNDLDIFALIVPCGIRQRGVSSMKLQLGVDLSLDEVAQMWISKFSEILGLPLTWASAEQILA